MAPRLEYVVVLSDEDPVARAVGAELGTPPTSELRVDGAPVRLLSEGAGLLRRPGLHIADDALHVPPSVPGTDPPTLVFPSVHRSAGNRETLTVHPLGNPGASAEVGGRPFELVPTDPRRMTDSLRRVAEVAEGIGWPASFEATHHGPWLTQPAFFIEIGAADFAHPPPPAVRGFARLLPEIRPDPRDRIAIGLGGGHYAPHFTELVLDRRWSVGHLLPDHALTDGGAAVVPAALRSTPGAEGALYHRARDAEGAAWGTVVPRCRERDAERRAPRR